MEEKTKLTKTKEWFENRKVFVVIIIALLVFVTISEVFKATADIKESVETLSKSEQQEVVVPKNKEQSSLTLQGKLVDKDDQAIKNATIEIIQLPGITDLTDDFGTFIIEAEINQPISNFEVVISKEGYLPLNKKMPFNENGNDLGKIILEKVKQKAKVQVNTPKKEAAKQSKTSFENTTVNGQIITNPSGPINIESNYTLPQDSTKND